MRGSYSQRLLARRKAFRLLRFAVLAVICTGSTRACLLQSWTVASASMQPGIQPGDRIMVSPLPFGARTLFGKLPPLVAPGRGQVVLVSPAGIARPSFGGRLLDSLARFFTFQAVSTLASRDSPAGGPESFKRVIAIPGDRIRMDDWVISVKTGGSEGFRTEFDVSGARYAIAGTKIPAGWDKTLPGSGSLPERTLGEDEFFLAGDARGLASDSLTRGPYGTADIAGRALFRFWPPSRLGTL